MPDGRVVFLNQFVAAWLGWSRAQKAREPSLTYGDGSGLDRDTANRVCDIAYTEAVDTPWQSTDVALVDNFVAMHARKPYNGTRVVLASLASPASANSLGF
jgi:hypothetical protein